MEKNRFETWGPRLGDELGDPQECIDTLQGMICDLRDVQDAIRAANRTLTMKYLRRLRLAVIAEPRSWIEKATEDASVQDERRGT